LTYESAICGYDMSNGLPETITYDANGNTTSKTDSTGTTTYSWDYDNRLTSVTLPGQGGTLYFKYDPFGRRIYKSSSSGTSIYAYDGVSLTEEASSSGGVVARYVQARNVDEPLAMLRSSTTSYFQADGLRSVTSLSNAAGTLAQTYTFDTFGNQTASSGSLINSFRYTGREFDAETNLYFYRARYFDPQAGRFLSEDPVGFAGGDVNFYSYVHNDPVLYSDPMGLSPAGGGNGCGNPPCFVQLKYRPVDPSNPKNKMTHSQWYVQNSSGQQFIITGGPSGGFLNVWSVPVSPNPQPDNSTVGWTAPPSAGLCQAVDNMLKAANAWPNDTLPYNWQGPNSNTIARSVGQAGGFNPPPPPGSTGWNSGLPIGP